MRRAILLLLCAASALGAGCAGGGEDPGASPPAWYADADGDGQGAGAPLYANTQPEGRVALGNDCDDRDPAIHPGAIDLPGDGIDQDCSGSEPLPWYVDEDGDGHGSGAPRYADLRPEGFSPLSDDCAPNASEVHPGAEEIPGDGVDQDCSGADLRLWYVDVEGDGHGAPAYTDAEPAGHLRAIYVLAGQSNMSGRGALGDLPEEAGPEDVALWNFTNAGRWEPAREPIDGAADQSYSVSADAKAAVGPGLFFARHLFALHPYQEVGLVPCAKGGSAVGQWQRDLSLDSLYGSCLARVAEAARAGEVKGLLFYQGESDAASEPLANAWPESFLQFVDDFRADIGIPALPVVYTQLGPRGGEANQLRYPFWDLVRERQGTVRHPNVTMVTASDLEVFDGLHLTTPSQAVLGQRYAEAMLGDLDAGTVPPSGP